MRPSTLDIGSLLGDDKLIHIVLEVISAQVADLKFLIVCIKLVH